jgi:hypothetical protein
MEIAEDAIPDGREDERRIGIPGQNHLCVRPKGTQTAQKP